MDQNYDALRFRVAAAFLADADLSAAVGRRGRSACRPPFFDETLVSFYPGPEPLLLPPPVSLLTVAQARLSASSSDARLS